MVCCSGENMVCKLKKTINGLKQSLRALFDKFNHIITEVGFQKCYSDHSVFIHKTSCGTVTFAVYVDDILLSRSNVDGIKKAKEYLKTQFVIKDMSMPRYFFRIEIAHSKHRVILAQ